MNTSWIDSTIFTGLDPARRIQQSAKGDKGIERVTVQQQIRRQIAHTTLARAHRRCRRLRCHFWCESIRFRAVDIWCLRLFVLAFCVCEKHEDMSCEYKLYKPYEYVDQR